MPDQPTPGQPTALYFTASADLASAYVYWTPSTSTPAATNFLVQWGLAGNDPLNNANPGAWLGSATVTASPATISGLTPGQTYDVSVTPQVVGNGATTPGTPGILSMEMQASDPTQDTYFSIYVPATAGPSYMRVGAPDQSTVESVLLSQWTDANGTEYPASLDLGSNATTGALIYSSSDVAILAHGDVRLRTPGGFFSAAGNMTSSTQGGSSSVVSPDGGLVSYTSTYKDVTNNWFTVKYDSTYNLSFSDTTGGTFAIAAMYDFFLGTKASNSFGSTVETKFNVAAVTLGYSAIEVDVGFGSLSTKMNGEEYDFRASKDITAGNVKLALTNEVATTAMVAGLTTASTALTAISAVITAFALIITATEWGYLETADAHNPTPMSDFLTDTSVPFYTTLQVANAAMFVAGLALGVMQIEVRRSTSAIDNVFVQLNNTPPATVEIKNGDSDMIMTPVATTVAVGSGGVMALTGTTASLALAAPSSSLILNATGASLSSSGTMIVNGTTSVTLQSGTSMIVVEPAGVTISGVQISQTSLKNMIAAGTNPLAEQISTLTLALAEANNLISAAQQAAVDARNIAQAAKLAADWNFSSLFGA